jgi:anti-anti-sigma factor
MDLTIETNKDGDITLLVINGELDDFHAPKLNDTFSRVIESEECKKLIVDLEGATFIDSVGLGTIAIAGKKLVQLNGNLNIVCTRAPIVKLISASGIIDAMGDHIGLYNSTESAKNAF